MNGFSVVVPTYNESANITPLLKDIASALEKAAIRPYEVLVMDDDSPDNTVGAVEAIGNPLFRAINRRGKPRGLSRAAIDGFSSAQYDAVALIDADFSHPPALLPELYRALEEGARVAVGSRYVKGGGIENWPFKRRFTSRAACFLAGPFTRVKDATSGFFVFRKSVIDGVALNPIGFKIGLEIFVRGRHNGRVVEVPYRFKDREAGESKLNGKVIGGYLNQLWTLLKGKVSA